MKLIPEEREQEIREITNNLQGKSLANIARENNIFFIESDLSTIWKGISGLIMYSQDRDEFGIFIEEKDHPNRKRFTFAHELGHYFLHKKFLQSGAWYFLDTEKSFSLFRTTCPTQYEEIDVKEIEKEKIREAEANCFAAEFLMPKDLVEKAYHELNYNIKELASFFRVSEQAMTFRLINLSLLSNQ